MAAALGHSRVLQHGPARCRQDGAQPPGLTLGAWCGDVFLWRALAWGEAGAGSCRAESFPRGEGGGGRG